MVFSHWAPDWKTKPKYSLSFVESSAPGGQWCRKLAFSSLLVFPRKKNDFPCVCVCVYTNSANESLIAAFWKLLYNTVDLEEPIFITIYNCSCWLLAFHFGQGYISRYISRFYHSVSCSKSWLPHSAGWIISGMFLTGNCRKSPLDRIRVTSRGAVCDEGRERSEHAFRSFTIMERNWKWHTTVRAHLVAYIFENSSGLF